MAANLNRNCYVTDKYFGNTPQMNHNDGLPVVDAATKKSSYCHVNVL